LIPEAIARRNEISSSQSLPDVHSIRAPALPDRSFLQNSLNSILHHTLHIDLPITIALLVTYFVSIYNLNIGTERTYFDSITGHIFLHLCGRSLDHFLQERALSELHQAMPLLSENA
jgi:Cu2+-exporting ATPase